MRASAVAGIVFANINDTLLEKLTDKRSIASVPFGARYRLIDFALSNLVNAGVSSIGIITKENYRSLMDHVGNGVYWDLDRKNGGLYLLPPYSTSGTRRYNGIVDALHGAIDYINRCNTEYIVLCNTYTIATVDVGAAVKSHIANNADVTLVYHHGKPPVNAEDTMFPVVEADGSVKKINFGAEPDKDTDFYAGVMIISRELLLRLINDAYDDGKITFFTPEIIDEILVGLKVYGFEHKEFTAVLDSTKAYYDANMALLDRTAGKQLFNTDRAVFTKTRDDMPTRYGTKSNVKNCLIADGCVINGTVKNSVIFRGVTVEKDAVVENCILMQETCVGQGAKLVNVIADKNAVINDNIVLEGTPENCVFIQKNQSI